MVDGKGRFRKQMIFRLNLAKDDEFELFEFLESLKRAREYSAVLRDAIRLVFEFKLGRYDLLCKLFPQVVARIRAEILRDETIERLEYQNHLIEQQNDLLQSLQHMTVVQEPSVHATRAVMVPRTKPMLTSTVKAAEVEDLAFEFDDMFD